MCKKFFPLFFFFFFSFPFHFNNFWLLCLIQDSQSQGVFFQILFQTFIVSCKAGNIFLLCSALSQKIPISFEDISKSFFQLFLYLIPSLVINSWRHQRVGIFLSYIRYLQPTAITDFVLFLFTWAINGNKLIRAKPELCLLSAHDFFICAANSIFRNTLAQAPFSCLK